MFETSYERIPSLQGCGSFALCSQMLYDTNTAGVDWVGPSAQSSGGDGCRLHTPPPDHTPTKRELTGYASYTGSLHWVATPCRALERKRKHTRGTIPSKIKYNRPLPPR
mmetsp:Transcript_26562/g.61805  ORF Transcript_26562/g.61805 Transcript_26562/m.61805 type:complete len:109 (+) Transcript_26562:334-660(+)